MMEGELLTPPYIPVPDTDFIKSLQSVPRKNKNRRRWKDADGLIYEWDYQHGELEMYSRLGRHRGVLSPDGEMKKGSERGRKIDV